MLPPVVLAIVQIAAGVAVGNVASNTVDKVVEVAVKKIVQAKQGESK